MHTSTRRLLLAIVLTASVSLMSCALFQKRDPLQATVAGFEPLEGQGMETRMNVKLRVQNPNDSPVDFNGVAVQMEVQGKTFATGVSDASGSIPRFGETVIAVPVTISAFTMLRHAMGMMSSAGNISYALKGKLSSTSGATSFTTKGEFELSGLLGAQSP